MKCKNCIVVLLAFILILSYSMPLKSQNKQSELKKGKSVSEILKTGDKHRYIVKLEANQFAYFRLEQKGIDAQVTTIDTDGSCGDE